MSSEPKLDLEGVMARRLKIVGHKWRYLRGEHPSNARDVIVDADDCIIAEEVWDEETAEFIANAPADIDALIAEVERLQDYHENAAANFTQAKHDHAAFLNTLWKIIGFQYEWEYPGQAERHIKDRLKELVRQTGAALPVVNEAAGQDGD